MADLVRNCASAKVEMTTKPEGRRAGWRQKWVVSPFGETTHHSELPNPWVMEGNGYINLALAVLWQAKRYGHLMWKEFIHSEEYRKGSLHPDGFQVACWVADYMVRICRRKYGK